MERYPAWAAPEREAKGYKCRQEMYLECFQSSLGSASLQWHLLAVRPTTLAAAVLAGNEYLQVQVRPTSTIHQVEDEPEAPPVAAASMQSSL